MGLNVGELFATILVKNRSGPPIKQFNRDLDDAAKKSQSSLGTVASNAAAMGTRLVAVASAGSVAAGGLAVAAQGGIALAAALAPAAGIIAALPGAMVLAKAATATLQVALAGVSEAFSAALADDPEAFKKSIAGLSPAAQAAAKELRAAKPAIDGLKSSVQDAFFQPLASQITAVAAALVGPLQSGMSGVAREFGLAGAAAAQFASSSASVQAVSAIFTSLRQAVADMRPAIEPLLAGFRDLAVVGAQFTSGLVPGIAGAAAKFGEFLSQAAASGQALGWMQGAMAVFQQLGTIVGSLVGIIQSIFSAMQTGGTNALGVLGQLLVQLNQFLASAQGQQILVTIFQSLSQVGSALFPIFQALGGAVAQIAPHIANIAVALGPGLAAAVTALGPALAALGPGLTLVAEMLSKAFASPEMQAGLLALGQGISALLSAVAPLLPLVGQLAGILGQTLGMALTNLSAVLAPVIEALASSLQPLLPQMSSLVTELAAAVGPLAAQIGQVLAQAIQVVLPPFVELTSKLLPPMMSLVKSLIPLVSTFVGVLSEILGAVQPIIAPLLQIVGDILPSLIKIVEGVVRLFRGDFSGALDMIVDAVTGLGSTLMNAGKALMEGLWNGIVAAGNAIKNNIVGFLRDILPGPVLDFLGIHSPSRLFMKIGKEVPAGLAQGILGAGGVVRTAAQRMAGIVAGTGIPDLAAPGVSLPGGMSVGGLGNARTVIHQTNYYPQAEPTSVSVNRGLQLAGALGVI
ncbi:Phage-related protein [Nonomuraea maritima]|uniref:Phage-related protein n=1 Tax=Nonomuraea maritima TaxID=683260 RepID=A0A1G9MFM9_9ACTN|nr:hypothetical protein [Nonomuraea maritima]SDL73072.1 Phage-related protein [Nonomuraea maritima]